MMTETNGPLAAVRTPYPRVHRDSASHLRLDGMGVAAVHVLAFAVSEVWVIWSSPAGWRGPAVAIAAMWLLIGPVLVVAWEHEVKVLATKLKWLQPASASAEQEPGCGQFLRPDRWRYPLIGLPVLLITPTPWSSKSLAAELHLHGSFRLSVAVGVLGLGGIAAGYGLWAAAKTLVVTYRVAHQDVNDEWNPFEGVAAPTSEALARFSFASALIFAAGGTCLMPGLLAGVLNTDGTVSLLLIAIMCLIGSVVIALIALPAWFLSARSKRHQHAYLKRLACDIEELTASVFDLSEPMEQQNYLRLRSLLEMRSHVITQPASPTSVELVKRIPVAILLPALTTGAAWLALI